MTDTVTITFLRGSAPYEAGDVAGFAPWRAEQFIKAGAAILHGTALAKALPTKKNRDQFDMMNRAELVAYGRDTLGMKDELPANVPDDDLREALRTAPAEPDKVKAKAGK